MLLRTTWAPSFVCGVYMLARFPPRVQRHTVEFATYEMKEPFILEVTLPEVHIITLPQPSSDLSVDKQLSTMCSALHQCLKLLETVMCREEEEFGIQEGGDYRKMQNTVKDRLGDLLHCMKLLTKGELPSHTEPTDGSKNGNTFALKIWIYRVLLELKHWIKCAIVILLNMQSLQETKRRVTRKRGAREMHGSEGEGGRERVWRSTGRRSAMEGKVAKGRCKAK
ncbi:ciliary neurotrophic factor isoform X2 [Brienomyrus brachyistius]|uniref:ciliary neurotrophic factor isoform X2 n=1 Tax=Brienomyrus brachyistius TaxID=42636 RepID=UPI0020B29104|nr:ciliary neurotrophic factor isoform X2 [Brienomyrus brachyistius]